MDMAFSKQRLPCLSARLLLAGASVLGHKGFFRSHWLCTSLAALPLNRPPAHLPACPLLCPYPRLCRQYLVVDVSLYHTLTDPSAVVMSPPLRPASEQAVRRAGVHWVG